MTRTTLALTAFAAFLALCWVASLAAVLLATAPALIALYSACGVVNGLCCFDVARHAVKAHVSGR